MSRVGRQVGSFFDGAIAWLSYADRLYQLPLGVVGIAIGIVLLPDLSRRLKAGDSFGSRYAYSRATEFALFLTVPAAVALCRRTGRPDWYALFALAVTYGQLRGGTMSQTVASDSFW